MNCASPLGRGAPCGTLVRGLAGIGPSALLYRGAGGAGRPGDGAALRGRARPGSRAPWDRCGETQPLPAELPRLPWENASLPWS